VQYSLEDNFINNIFEVFGIRNRFEFFSTEELTSKFSGSEKVKQIFNEINMFDDNDDFSIFYNLEDKQNVEVAVSFTWPIDRIKAGTETPIFDLLDTEHNVKYDVGDASDHYVVWVFKKLFDKYKLDFVENRRSLSIIRRRARTFIIDSDDDVELIQVMRKAAAFVTLKVKKPLNSSFDLLSAVDSYSYTIMCNLHEPLRVYSLEDILPILKSNTKEKNYEFDVPKRIYNNNLIDYYNLAISSNDPFVSYISYYHIIEYFYDEVFREQQINNLRRSITAPKFSYRDDNQLFSIIEKIVKDNKTVRENGSGNEFQSLNYVLNKYLVEINDFKERFDQVDLDFYEKHIVSFSKGGLINWSSSEKEIIKAISNRLYYTRNSLVHSKSTKKDTTYHPYLHRDDLNKEISLIKNIAEMIIEKDSTFI